jgi:hypothetical protein
MAISREDYDEIVRAREANEVLQLKAELAEAKAELERLREQFASLVQLPERDRLFTLAAAVGASKWQINRWRPVVKAAKAFVHQDGSVATPYLDLVDAVDALTEPEVTGP